jgi:SOS-response transcriptional repressor LexA
MTPAQKNIYLIIDEWWKMYGFGPTIDDIMHQSGEKGRGNVSRKMRDLILIGMCKGVAGKARSIRPAYMKIRNIE